MESVVEEIRPGVFMVKYESDGIAPVVSCLKVEVDKVSLRSGVNDLVTDALISWHRSKKR